MQQTLSNSELSFFSGQLSMILHSGISILEGISILRDDTPDGEGKKILDQVYESMEMGSYLHEALSESGVYPEYFIKMTKIGEESGTLEEVMDSLSSYYEKQDALSKTIRDALLYPLVLMGMLLAVLMVLMLQVMPVFEQVFEQLGIEINGFSGAVFTASHILQNVAVILLIMIAAFGIWIFLSLRTRKGRAGLIRLLIKLPIGKKVNRLLSCARFCDALSISIHSGLDMGESFELASSLTEDEELRKKTLQVSQWMEEGKDMAEALRDAGIISGLNARMVSIGFRSGSAENALKRVSVTSQEEADHTIESAVAALEPALTAILSILTGIILISVMLPLLSVMSTIG